MSEPADLVIVGGGPAGTAAGITALQRGAKVTLLETNRKLGAAPGETLHPGVAPILTQLGILEAVEAAATVRPQTQWIVWNEPPSEVPYGADSRGPWRAFQVPRSTLNGLLRKRFVALGGALVQPLSRVTVLQDGKRVYGVNVEGVPLPATVTIDASGARGMLRRGLGIKMSCVSARLVARYGYVRGTFGDAPWLRGNCDGWSWIAQVSSERVAWVRLGLGRSQQHYSPPDPIATWSNAGDGGAANVTWRMAEQVAGAGWFLAGEAACVLDPASSHGVLRALMSGMMAGDSAVALLRGAAQLKIERGYAAWLQSWFQHDVARLSALYDAIDFDWRPTAAASSMKTPCKEYEL